jgi:hypothetical protein
VVRGRDNEEVAEVHTTCTKGPRDLKSRGLFG